MVVLGVVDSMLFGFGVLGLAIVLGGVGCLFCGFVYD